MIRHRGAPCWTIVFSSFLWAGCANWALVQPSESPGARKDHAMAYIGTGKVLLFGGESLGSLQSDTWVYDVGSKTWTKRSGPGPSARHSHAMAYIGGDKVMLFGGSKGTGTSAETWVYDLSQNEWTQMASTGDNPGPRVFHAVAYVGGDRVLLYGGHTPAGTGWDTYVYDLSDNKWTKKMNVSPPGRRSSHAMAYLGDDQVLLFGGQELQGVLGKGTWVYDLSQNTWTEKNVPGPTPVLRMGHQMAFVRDTIAVLFGGRTLDVPAGKQYDAKNDTWKYLLNANEWVPDTDESGTLPAPRTDHGFARSSSVGEGPLVMFGGIGGDSQVQKDTWTYSPEGDPWVW